MVFKLEISAEDVNIIGAALAEMPYGSVVDLMTRLQQQITQQEAEKAIKAAEGTKQAKKPTK